MIWLAGLLNRASDPAVADPVNPHTMGLCVCHIEHGWGARAGVCVEKGGGPNPHDEKPVLLLTALRCVYS